MEGVYDMTTAQALLKNLQNQDVEVTVVGSKLRVGGLEEVLTETLCVLLDEQKADLIAQLAAMIFSPPDGSLVGPDQPERLSDVGTDYMAEDDLLQEYDLFDQLSDVWCQLLDVGTDYGIEDDLLQEYDPLDQPSDICLQCGAEAWYYDGDGEGFCGNDCYRAYHQQCQASPEPACVTLGAFEQDVTAIGEQIPQAARKAPSGFFSLRNTAKRYQLHVTKQQRNWFMSLSTRSMPWTIPFPDKQLVYTVQDINAPHRIACKQLPHLCRPPNLQQVPR